jgi:hypothetical protein
MTRFTVSTTSPARPLTAGLALGLALSLATAPLPVLAAPPTDAGEAAGPSEAQVGGNVAILKFTGDDYRTLDFRERIRTGLENQGYTANFIKRSIEEAKQTNKCRTLDGACLEKIGAYLNKNSKVAYDYYAWADVPASGTATITIYSIAEKKKVVEFNVTISSGDYILPEVIGATVAKRLVATKIPPAPATEEELQIIAALDEPAETPEELAARAQELQDAADEAARLAMQGFDPDIEPVDLKGEFKDYCRTGPREDQESTGEDGEISTVRDLRPPCKRGPAFGYWQPRAWVALTLALGSAAGMGVMYGLAAAARSNWRTAADALESSGLSATDPNAACSGGVCYADLAGDVSVATGQIRRRAIVGDALLGTTVLLTGVLAIIIYQDRQAARAFLMDEKRARALSNLRVGPMLGEANGASLGFEF